MAARSCVFSVTCLASGSAVSMCGLSRGTATPEDVTAGDSAKTWSFYPAGAVLPAEIVNGVPLTRVRLPDRGGLRRSFQYLRTLYRHCRLYRPDVLQLFGTLRFNAVPWLWLLRAMGIPSIYAVTITSKLYKERKSPLRRWLTMRDLRNRALFNALDCIIVNNAKMRELMREMGGHKPYRGHPQRREPATLPPG
jgi:hypothetical protein